MRAVSLLTLSVFAAILFTPFRVLAQNGDIGGKMLSRPGEVPLRSQALCLASTEEGSDPVCIKTHQDGSFQFEAVPLGRYLVLEENEYTDFARSGRRADRFTDRIVEVTAGRRPPPLVLHLAVGSIIQGLVTDNNGQPVPGLRVGALRTRTVNGISHTFPEGGGITFPDGTYQIIRLRPGAYSLSAQIERNTEDGIEKEPNPPVDQNQSFIRTFYPATTNAESAGSVTVVADQVLTDVNIQMQSGSVFVVRGVVVNAPVGRNYVVYVQRKQEPSTLRMIRVAENKSFSIGGLSPGVYSLELLDKTRGMHFGPPVIAHTEVNVKANIEDVQLAIKPLPVVSARVSGLPDVAQLRLFLRPTSNPTAPIVFSQRNEDGSFTFRAASPEPNVLTVTGLPSGMAIQQVMFNRQPATNAVVDLTGGGGTIEVIIGPGKL